MFREMSSVMKCITESRTMLTMSPSMHALFRSLQLNQDESQIKRDAS